MELKNMLNIDKALLAKLQKRIIDISFKHRLAHLGSCLSTLPILIEIYENKKENDIMVLSNGHAGLALYVILEHYENLDAEQLYLKHGVHPKKSDSDKIFCSAGSLGQGLTVAVGYAIANPDKTVYTLISDGETGEGSIWESLRFVKENEIENIVIFCNMNGYSAINKLDLGYLSKCLNTFYPNIVLRYTDAEPFKFLKGLGLEAHYRIMNEQEYKSALEELL